MNFLVRLFRRETASTQFIPEIDGLRFLALALVIVYHLNFIIGQGSAALQFDEQSQLTGWTLNRISNGYQGVELFFVISGFILTLPFMRFYL